MISMLAYLTIGMLLTGCADNKGTDNSGSSTVNVIEENPVSQEESVFTESDEAEESSEAQDDNASEENVQTSTDENALADGIYVASFDTDSSMFRVNETKDGKGTLTVKNGQMTIHVTLLSQKILNLYPGLAEDASKDGAVWLEPTVDTVTYSDGLTEEVFGFDVPVPYLDKEFDLALVGTKGTWYDHKVVVSNPVAEEEFVQPADENVQLADGSYTVEFDFEGGSGKAYILSPTQIFVENGVVMARVEWSSPNYDYMVVNGEKYLPVNTEGNSVFEIPVLGFDCPMAVIGDTVAMSKPHEIEYTLTFHLDTVKPVE